MIRTDGPLPTPPEPPAKRVINLDAPRAGAPFWFAAGTVAGLVAHFIGYAIAGQL